MKNIFAFAIATILTLSPIGFLLSSVNVFAAGPGTPPASSGGSCPSTFTTYPKDFKEVVCFFLGFINKLLPILVAMTMLVFFWGLVGLIRNSGDEKAVKEGKQLMLWGIVGLFVLVSFAGIISLFTGDFFGQSFGIPQLPQ